MHCGRKLTLSKLDSATSSLAAASRLLCISLAMLFGLPDAHAGELLVHNFGGEDSGEIGALDPHTGAFGVQAVLQGISAPGPLHIYELTYVVDTAVGPDGSVYASTLDWVVGAPSGYFSRLWKLDLQNPTNSEFIGYIGGRGVGPYYANGLAFGPDGKLYAAGYSQLNYEAAVFEIDMNPTVYADDPYQIKYAVPNIRITHGFSDYGGDIAFTCDGTMYMTTMWSGTRPLIRVDLNAGTLTPLPTLAPSDDFNSLAYDPVHDALYGVTLTGDVYQFDRTTGAATFLSTATLSPGQYGIAGATWSEAPTDIDSDGTCDVNDICLLGDDNLDADSDGVPDACDLCPTEDSSGNDLDGDGCLDAPTCDLVAMSNFVAALPPTSFSKASRQKTLLKKIEVVSKKESIGSYCGGAAQLTHDILPKTDGAASPSDWVVESTSQAKLADMVIDCIAVFEDLGSCN